MTVSFVGVGDINKTYHFKTAARMFFFKSIYLTIDHFWII